MKEYSEIEWPELETISCVKGRAATEDDIRSGSAVFMLEVDGESVGVPLGIEIPQYAVHLDEETNQKTPGVIIQAEESEQGAQVIGFNPLNSEEYMVALVHEFELLGSTKP